MPLNNTLFAIHNGQRQEGRHVNSNNTFQLNHQTLQLYSHPVVRNLWDSQQAMLRIYSAAQKENQRLKEELRELKHELQEKVDKLSSERSYHYPPDMHSETFRAPSLSPSDSISQAGRSRTPSANSVTQPSTHPILVDRKLIDRPVQYPPSILWHLHDCQHEPGLVTRATKSRPSMERCIRHPNGQLIVRYEWRQIMASAKRVIQEVLRPLSPSDVPLNTRTYYKSAHLDAWQRAIACLEAQEPLVALCAFHWKAEHVLGQMLVSKRSVEVRVAQYKEAQKLVEDGEINNASHQSIDGP